MLWICIWAPVCCLFQSLAREPVAQIFVPGVKAPFLCNLVFTMYSRRQLVWLTWLRTGGTDLLISIQHGFRRAEYVFYLSCSGLISLERTWDGVLPRRRNLVSIREIPKNLSVLAD